MTPPNDWAHGTGPLESASVGYLVESPETDPGDRLFMSSLIGTWSLISWEIRSSSGKVSYPLGEDPQGMITYDEGGWMSVQVMRPDRPISESADPFGTTAEEIVSAWMGFISYAGRFEEDRLQKRVVHHVEVSSFPNWVGSRQERFYDLDGDHLVLSTPPMTLGGESTVSTLLWKSMSRT